MFEHWSRCGQAMHSSNCLGNFIPPSTPASATYCSLSEHLPGGRQWVGSQPQPGTRPAPGSRLRAAADPSGSSSAAARQGGRQTSGEADCWQVHSRAVCMPGRQQRSWKGREVGGTNEANTGDAVTKRGRVSTRRITQCAGTAQLSMQSQHAQHAPETPCRAAGAA